MATGNIVHHLGSGLAAARPEGLDLSPGALGIYHASDTGELWLWVNNSQWESRGSAGTGSSAGRVYSVVSEGAAFTADPAVHAGLDTYTRAGGNVSFNSAEGYAAGEVYPIRATTALSLSGTGVTLTPPYGGSLALQAGMSVQVVMTSPTAGDVIGQTVPA